MAELSISGASSQAVQDEDRDFEPTADMLVHDFDDEQTMEEEEMLQGETNFSSEIDDLTREGEMPLHDLLKMYGYGVGDSAEEEDEGAGEQDVSEDDESSSAKPNKERGIQESYDQEEDCHLSSELSPYCNRTHTAQLLCSEPRSYFDGNYADETEDEDYIPSEDWRKEVKVGPMYQAETPSGLCEYKDNEKVYENEDQLLWNPELLPEDEVEEYLAEASKRAEEKNEAETGVVVPEKPLIKDNELALFELVKCNFNKEAALSSLKCSRTPAKEELSVWTKEQEDFDQDDEANENDLAQDDKQIKLWRRKPSLQPDVPNITERRLGEIESTEGNQAVPISAGASSSQWKSENSTSHNGVNAQSAIPVSSRGLEYTTADLQLHSSSSSSSTDVVRRLASQRGNEDDEERPLKKLKTEVEFFTSAASV